MIRFALAALLSFLASCAGTGAESGEWLDPWEHGHASPSGTPYVHPIGMEPAFLGRELLFTYEHVESPGETEGEVEAEVEWAVTKRLGLAVGVPFVSVSEAGGETHAGIGDFSVAPRALFVKTDGLLVAASVDMTFPTGDTDRDLGGGEMLLGPALTSWSDLGHRLTLQARVGTEHGMESGDAQLDYYASLIWRLDDDHHEAQHVHAGMASLIAEFGGRRVLDGANEGRSTSEALLGASYALGERWEIRGGFQFPVGGPQDIDFGLIAGAIFHF